MHKNFIHFDPFHFNSPCLRGDVQRALKDTIFIVNNFMLLKILLAMSPSFIYCRWLRYTSTLIVIDRTVGWLINHPSHRCDTLWCIYFTFSLTKLTKQIKVVDHARITNT